MAKNTWAAVLAAALLAGGCTTAAQPPPPEATAADPPAEPRTADALGMRPIATGDQVTVTLKALDRVAPHRIVARLLVRNEGAEEHSFGPAVSVPWNNDRLHSNSIGGLSVVDSRHGKRYFPLGYGDQSCLCTRGWPSVGPGESLELVAVFPAPPADVTHLNVLFPPAPPFLDIPLGTAPPEPLTVDDSGNDPVDPLSERTTDPLVLSLVDQVDDEVKARDDDGEKLTVRLSTDVLFKVNEAELTGRAQAALRQVAADIDRSAGDTVTVEGHADSTGTHAINDPLSERRARRVEAALRRLVTRPGLRYEVRGHGSRRPIADNDTPEGRRVNRRVSVAFTRPRPAATESPAPQTSPQGHGGPAGDRHRARGHPAQHHRPGLLAPPCGGPRQRAHPRPERACGAHLDGPQRRRPSARRLDLLPRLQRALRTVQHQRRRPGRR